MLTSARSWRRRDPPADLVAELEHDGRLSPLAARLLALRGLDSSVGVERYFARRLADLHKPQAMRDMDIASNVLAEAINQRKRILIHGDYDVDGSTSAALLAWFVRACRHEAVVFIPHRRIDGYGLSEASLHAVQEHRAELMITVDCGIADHGWAARIEESTGCRVVITDHHLPQAEEPRCTAIVNPNQRNCTYPDKHLAGVGVAWKLAWATATVLAGADKVPTTLREVLLDTLALVAVGTVSDCASLDGENRILVHHGLTALKRTANPGLRALLEHTRLGDDATAGDLGWRIGPLLNASGRVGSAMDNIRLLTATSIEAAREHLTLIVAENEERKRLTQVLTSDLVAEVERGGDWQRRSTLVFAGEGWHQGVVGIVASRLVEQFGKPAAVIAINDGQGKGSLRSVPTVHLGEALESCREHMIKGGGHAMAAGLSIDPAQVTAFSAAFEAYVAARVPVGSSTPRTEYDADVSMTELDADFFDRLEAMQPFGIGNPEPVLRLDHVAFVSRPRPFGKEGDHLRGALTDPGGGLREFLAWRAGTRIADFSAPGARFEMLVKPQPQRWRGELQPRLVFVDGKSCQVA